MSVVVQSLSTTSDKIRALILEGYLRTEVAQFLGIRYQHVRKVLFDSGMKEGMQRGFATAPQPRQRRQTRTETVAEVLVEGGFTKLGNWVADQNGGIALAVPAPRDPGVYAFVVGGVVKYIGLTRTGFHKRMANYRAGNVRQRTSHRINKIIIEHVSAGTVVEVFLATPPPLEWNGLPVNSAAGLEAGLIEMIQPEWNLMGVDRVVSL